MKAYVFIHEQNDRFFVGKYASLVKINNKEPSPDELLLVDTNSPLFKLILKKHTKIILIPEIYQKGTYISTYVRKVIEYLILNPNHFLITISIFTITSFFIGLLLTTIIN